MIRFAFKKGLRFLEGVGRRWTVNRQLVTGKIQLEDDAGELKNLEIKELNQQWLQQKLIVDPESLGSGNNVFYLATPRDIASYSEKDQEIAQRKQKYLVRLENRKGGWVSTPTKLQPIIDEYAQEIGDPDPPCASTVYAWWLKYRATKCITKLVDQRFRAGRKTDPVMRGFFEDAVYSVFLTEQKDKGYAVFDAMSAKVKNTNLGLPPQDQLKMVGKATVYRWLSDLHQYLVAKARLGKEAGEKEFRAALKNLKVSRILERVEIDHTPVDLIVIDKATKLPLGRPWLTMAIDRYSRMIMGFYISFHAPSSMSVLQCLKMAMLPKDCLLAKYPDIKEIWPARGIPEMIACDNGMDLHSDAFEKICLEIGIEILYCPAGIPEMKGAIERMFRTLNEGLIHRLPGTVFSNVDERGDYPSEEVAAIDLDTLTHLVIKWITEVYHRRKHRELKMPPLTAWIEGEQQRIIEMPAYPAQLDVLVGIPASRTLWHYGIENDCLRYNSDVLQLLRARIGGYPTVSFKFYEHDVGYIHVFDEINQEYIRVPAVDAEYATGLTSRLHTLIRQYAKRKYGTEQYEELMLQAKQEIQQIIGQAVKDKKMATRKKVAVVTNQSSDDLFGDHDALNDALKSKDEEISAQSNSLEPGLDDDLPDFGVSRRTGTEG